MQTKVNSFWLVLTWFVKVLMPERQTVTRRCDGQPTFHVFYELLAGAAPELRKKLFLDNISAAEPCAFLIPLQTVTFFLPPPK